MSDKCQGFFGRMFGHKYAPRYSTGKPAIDPARITSVFSMVFSSDMANVISASKPKTYHGDVCERCGKRLETPEPKP